MMFEKYRRTNIAEIRPYVEGEELHESVSISPADRADGSPKLGDMIARNPESHEDQWLIAADYFAANFEPYGGVDAQAEIERLALDRDAQADNATEHFDRANGLSIENKALRAEIERSHAAIRKANAQAEHFEREWYLRGDEIERLKSDLHAAECEIEELRDSRDFYKRRCDELQKAQRHMRDPERKAVCDILANGKTAALAGKATP